ncbi:MAG: AAA family ATPase [Oscillospiraceae bacterium]|nr:AAA family ATPase [Oscillospiraceae bacterium]
MSAQSVVRIQKIEIENFKNVKHGSLSLKNNNKRFDASVLGLYGQNGSGKTALIDSLAVLQSALSGRAVPRRFADYINMGSDFARLRFEFSVTNVAENGVYDAVYEFCIRKELDDASHNMEQRAGAAPRCKAVLYNERLSASYKSDSKKIKMTPIADTDTDGVFSPKAKYIELVGGGKDAETDMLVAKKLSLATSSSFLFSKDAINTIRKNCKKEKLLYLFDRHFYFGNSELFVVDSSSSGLISINVLPLVFNYKDAEQHRIAAGKLAVALNVNEPFPVSSNDVDVIKKVVSNMNIVLTQLLPGLTIGVKELGALVMKDGASGVGIQLMSQRNGREIPLRYESDGIKKIVSVLQVLIAAYNSPSITVAIDELDSGIFEYLLGELLRIISEKGKGQLIFTSHNLRPLETLDKGFVAFTTTNPDNRYIRMCNVKSTNNFRDFYYRDIVLGEQSEPVYEPTNNYEIEFAFREAGGVDAS